MPTQQIDARTLKDWLDSGEAVLVDVRDPAEHVAHYISGAVLIPLNRMNSVPLPEHAGKKLVLHCKSGIRSISACNTLQKRAPDATLYSLSGGIGAWVRAGFPVEGTGRALLPLDQQVQLAIGTGLVALSLLAWFVSPLFLIGTGAMGLGLTVAGLTGFCGLARVIALMPWNQKG